MYGKIGNTCKLTGKPNQQKKPAPLDVIPGVEKPFVYLLLLTILAHFHRDKGIVLTAIC